MDPAASEYLTVSAEQAGLRIDQFAASYFPNLTRAEAQRLIERDISAENGIFVNGNRVKPNYRVRIGDELLLVRAAGAPSHAVPELIPLDIVYEDAHLFVINKARGMVVHPAPGNSAGTLVNAVLGYTGEQSAFDDDLRPGIVHRLDKDTGGLLVVARTDAALRSLQSQIQNRTAERRYNALVWGVPDFETATIDAPIGRHPVDRKRMAVITDSSLTSRHAVTELQRLKAYGSLFSLWEAKLQTGRTHQIRVHCGYIRHPIVGDTTYGGIRTIGGGVVSAPMAIKLRGAIDVLNGQALHAVRLAFDHPATGKRMEFAVPVAPVIQRLLDLIETVI